MSDAEALDAPPLDQAADPPGPDLKRARARAYLDLFERHLALMAQRWSAPDARVSDKR